MGQYIGCGIATKLTVKKSKQMWSKELSKEGLINCLSKQVNLDIYSINEDEECFYLTIKEELFEENAIPFISEQLMKIDSKYYEEDLKELKKLQGKKYKDLLEEAKEKSLPVFNFMQGNIYSNDVSYLMTNGYDCYADTIVYFCEGKAILECYNDLFKYLRKLIIESSKNPIKDAVVVSLI